ncbi:MAG: hypothetical protein H6674_01720 [Dehalococcoidia bacterium]|nr:hypothetical protein [Dehalococcoidia bacterium]MCB9490767.1 hypothetical protein [Dehalococcoidia bacterium]
MAGTLKRAGGEIVRRSTAAGLGGLAIALLVGVLSFAFTTRPAGQQQESVARYLTVTSRVVDLGSDSLQRTASSIADVLPGGRTSAANQEPLEASLVTSVPDLGLTRALVAARVAPEHEDAASSAIAASTPPPAEAASASDIPAGEPDLAPGDVITATVSFYYCQRGDQGLHPGDGGNFCGVMRDGSVVYPGAAACAYKYLGQQFRIVGDPTGRIYRCADTGSAVHGVHRDIWFMTSDDGWDWQLVVGQVATIEILP